ncbi:MAG: BREX-1 system adenine-specific DNA-methyltransferase PglX, partial [Desulfobacula sp.]|uniref:BREX-1 system adenine-specific DNA-methyltransferase PglX n=1 Tax=Desulfobacula sp. TaxID=2593537 RepID=UPI0039B9B9EF|nr:BREX-1 system adenine-specific DNA-methyltransferase PglX [Desulfobacula sp.]
MNTSQLKQFAQNARRQLIELVSTKLTIVLDASSAARRENEKAVKDLKKEISRTSEDQVIEKVAYIWFNRFCALRFMDVNRYTSIGVVSPSEGFSQPEILMEAKQGHIDAGLRIDKDRVFGLLNETIPSPEPQQEAYRMILVAVCNDYNSIMPFLFEKIADYTELLMPDDLLSDSSILTATREALSEEACADVEVIGWLYQFYISEKKDEVFAELKKNKKVTPENIPAATQLFTPNWIVRYLVENSLGRLWMLNNPGSNLIDRMEYYIKPEQEETDFLVINSPEEIKICDPACGSGHMLVYAFEILYAIYEEEGYDAPKIPQLILEKNLYGIEIDERAGELAAFSLFMKAREKYRRFFRKTIQPNICVLENISFESHEIKNYLNTVNPDLFTMDLQTLLYQFKEADNFGSLIRPELTNISDVLHLLDEKKVSDDMFL